MRVLVTGGAGFIGSHLACACVRAGEQVRVLDDFSSGRRENLGELAGEVEWFEGCVADPELCRRAAAGCEVVYHQAALPSVPLSIADPLRAHRVNALGTLNALCAARDAGARRFVYAASCAVYGSGGREPLPEGALAHPLSPYAVQKYAGELYCQQFARLYELPAVALRYFNVFGPRQDPASPYAAVIPLFLGALRRGEPPRVFGDGGQTRDFVYVADVVSANRAAAQAPAETVAGRVFNVGRGEQHSLLEVIALLAKILDAPQPQPLFLPPRPGDIRHSQADVRAIESALGWKAQHGLEDGLRALAAAER